MRTLNEVLERKSYLEWFRKQLVYDFQTTPLSKYWYAVASAYFRTLDNEIDMLRWMLGELENTWEDDFRGWHGLLDVVRAEPQTRYPRLPLGADYRTFWGKLPRYVCPYFFGPDSPKDDQSFDFSKVLDPATWQRGEYRHLHPFARPGAGPRLHDWRSLDWMAQELGEKPVGDLPTTPIPPVGD